jgi:hypothetical protein
MELFEGIVIPSNSPTVADSLGRPKRVDGMGQENPDAEKYNCERGYLRHRTAFWRLIPGNAVLRNSR